MRCSIPDGSARSAVHAYVSPDVHRNFEAYAAELGVPSSSSLLALLIARELRIERLGREARPPVVQPRGAKVSTYIDGARAERFRERAAVLGRSQSACAGELVAREMQERWLDRSLASIAEDEG